MTKTFKSALMAALLVGGAMASCSNEVPENSVDTNLGNILVKAPEMIAYTSDQTLGEYGTKAEETEKKWEYVSHNDVEINLSLNDEMEQGETKDGVKFDKDYIQSHLSIHVRTPQDVKVTIPASLEYVCEADDMEIVKNHAPGEFVYGDLNHELTMKINNNDVKVTVSYENDVITITTNGINEDVIDYLAENYFDGITFEIWNYYNTGKTREEIKALLDGSTVEFIDGDENVDYYVNAFYKAKKIGEDGKETGEREANPWDCEVNIIESQAVNFVVVNSEDADEFHGYNNSGINKVWKHKRETTESTEPTDEQITEE